MEDTLASVVSSHDLGIPDEWAESQVSHEESAITRFTHEPTGDSMTLYESEYSDGYWFELTTEYGVIDGEADVLTDIAHSAAAVMRTTSMFYQEMIDCLGGTIYYKNNGDWDVASVEGAEQTRARHGEPSSQDSPSEFNGAEDLAGAVPPEWQVHIGVGDSAPVFQFTTADYEGAVREATPRITIHIDQSNDAKITVTGADGESVSLTYTTLYDAFRALDSVFKGLDNS